MNNFKCSLMGYDLAKILIIAHHLISLIKVQTTQHQEMLHSKIPKIRDDDKQAEDHDDD